LELERGRCGEWEALVAPAGHALCAAIAESSRIRERCARILRDDRRSFVGILDEAEFGEAALGEAALTGGSAGGPIVAKSPRGKDRRFWSRVRSLAGESQAFRTLRAVAALEAAGVPTPSGLLALERRRSGMVIESWLFTRWVDGAPCTALDVPDVIAVLRRLHAAGWVHGDAHIQNFVRGPRGVVVLDPGPHPRRWGAAAAAYDLILLRNSRPDIAAAYALAVPESERKSAAFRIASRYDDWVHGWRRLKRAIRGWMGTEARASD
jgi:heptose II phosphotransferase